MKNREPSEVLKGNGTALLGERCIMHDRGVKYEEPRRGMHLGARNA